MDKSDKYSWLPEHHKIDRMTDADGFSAPLNHKKIYTSAESLNLTTL